MGNAEQEKIKRMKPGWDRAAEEGRYHLHHPIEAFEGDLSQAGEEVKGGVKHQFDKAGTYIADQGRKLERKIEDKIEQKVDEKTHGAFGFLQLIETLFTDPKVFFESFEKSYKKDGFGSGLIADWEHEAKDELAARAAAPKKPNTARVPT